MVHQKRRYELMDADLTYYQPISVWALFFVFVFVLFLFCFFGSFKVVKAAAMRLEDVWHFPK